MSRRAVVLISVLAIAIFLGLTYYGWKNRWGGPMDTTITAPPVLSMPRLDKTLKLELADFTDSVWEEITPLTVPLLYQVTIAPHAQNLVPKLDVRAFQNGQDAYFLFEWKDDVESRKLGVADFPDGVAVAFSLTKDPPAQSIMMGFESPLNFWQWKANLDAAFWGIDEAKVTDFPNDLYTYVPEAQFPDRDTKIQSACQDLLADRPGTITQKEMSALSGRGQWSEGKWRVIIKRQLLTDEPEEDVQFISGKKYTVFAVWNGDKGDRGSRKSISDWVILDMEAVPQRVEDKSQARNTARGWAFPLIASASAEEADPLREEKKPRVITIKAKRFVYIPNEITVQKGEEVTIRLESLDVTHGFYLDGYGINIKTNPAVVGTATFVANKTGRFSFRCSVTCGEFHPYMIGFLTVEPNTRFRIFIIGILIAFIVLVVVFTVIRVRPKLLTWPED